MRIYSNRLDLIFTQVPAVVKSKVCEYIGTSDNCDTEMYTSVNQYAPNTATGKRSGSGIIL